MTEEWNFCYGDALGVLCGDDYTKLLPTIINEATPAKKLEGGWLLAWPDSSKGIISLICTGAEGAPNKLVASWPFRPTGVLHQLHIGTIHEDANNSLVRMMECHHGDVDFTLFDTFCYSSVHGLTSGAHVAARIHGWAIMLEAAPAEPFILLPDQVSESMREAFREIFERDGKLTLDTSQMAALLPYGEKSSPLHKIQGVITSICGEEMVAGLSLLSFTVTVARSDVEDGEEDIDIEVTVTSEIWQGNWPKIGDAVRGVVWLQAAFEPAD